MFTIKEKNKLYEGFNKFFAKPCHVQELPLNGLIVFNPITESSQYEWYKTIFFSPCKPLAYAGENLAQDKE